MSIKVKPIILLVLEILILIYCDVNVYEPSQCTLDGNYYEFNDLMDMNQTSYIICRENTNCNINCNIPYSCYNLYIECPSTIYTSSFGSYNCTINCNKENSCYNISVSSTKVTNDLSSLYVNCFEANSCQNISNIQIGNLYMILHKENAYNIYDIISSEIIVTHKITLDCIGTYACSQLALNMIDKDININLICSGSNSCNSIDMQCGINNFCVAYVHCKVNACANMVTQGFDFITYDCEEDNACSMITNNNTINSDTHLVYCRTVNACNSIETNTTINDIPFELDTYNDTDIWYIDAYSNSVIYCNNTICDITCNFNYSCSNIIFNCIDSWCEILCQDIYSCINMIIYYEIYTPMIHYRNQSQITSNNVLVNITNIGVTDTNWICEDDELPKDTNGFSWMIILYIGIGSVGGILLLWFTCLMCKCIKHKIQNRGRQFKDDSIELENPYRNEAANLIDEANNIGYKHGYK